MSESMGEAILTLRANDAQLKTDLAAAGASIKAFAANASAALGTIKAESATAGMTALGAAVRASGTAAGESESKFKALGDTLKIAAGNALAQGFVSLTAHAKEAAAGALDVGMAVQSALAKFQAVGGGADALSKMGISMDNIHDKALQVTRDFGTMPQASAEGLYQLETAGFSAANAMQAIGGAAALARDQQIGLGNAAKFTAGVENAFDIQASQTTQVVGVMSAVANASAIEVGDLAESLSYAGPVAGALGYSFKDVSVAIGLMGNNMIVGSMAGTSLRTMMTSLANDSSNGSKALHELGIATQTAGGNMVPLGTIMQELRTQSQSLTDAEKEQLAQAISGKTGMAGLLAIMNSTDAQYQAMTKSVDDGAGAMKRYQDAIEATFGYQVNQAKANIAGLEDSLFRGLSPALQEVGKEFNATFGTAGAQAGAQKLGEGFGKVITDISHGVSDLARTDLPPLKTALGELFAAAMKIAPDFEATLKSVADNGIKLFTGAVNLAKGAIEVFGPEIQIALGAIRGLADFLGSNAVPVLAGATTAFMAFKAATLMDSAITSLAAMTAKLGLMSGEEVVAIGATDALTASVGLLDIAFGPVGIALALGAAAAAFFAFSDKSSGASTSIKTLNDAVVQLNSNTVTTKNKLDALGVALSQFDEEARNAALAASTTFNEFGQKTVTDADVIIAKHKLLAESGLKLAETYSTGVMGGIKTSTSDAAAAIQGDLLKMSDAQVAIAAAGAKGTEVLGVAATTFHMNMKDIALENANYSIQIINDSRDIAAGVATDAEKNQFNLALQKLSIDALMSIKEQDPDPTGPLAKGIEARRAQIQTSTTAIGTSLTNFIRAQAGLPSAQGPALMLTPKVSIVPDDPAIIAETKKEAARLQKELSDIMGGNQKLFAKDFESAWDDVPSALATSLQNNLGPIQAEIGKLAATLQQASPQIRTEMKGVFNAITAAAEDSKGAGDLPNVIRQQWEAAQGIIKTLSPALQAQVKQTFTDMANVALQQNSVIAAAAGQAFVGVSGVIGERLDTTRGVVVDRWGRIVDAMTGKTQEIETVAQKAAGDAYTKTIQDIDRLQGAFDKSKTGLGDAFKTALGTVDTAVASGAADWQKTADDGWKAVSAIIGKDPKLEASAKFQWDKYVGEIKAHEDAIRAAATADGAAAGTGLSAGFDSTTGKFTGAIDAAMVQANASLKKHLDPEEAKSVGNLYVTGVASGVDAGKTGVTTATDAVSKSMTDTQTSVDTTMTAITNSVTTGMTGAQTAVQTGMANLAAAVLSGGSVMIHDADITASNVAIAFGSGDWYSVGAQIDAGVASGISANSGAISGAATGAMDNAMAAARAHMQIASPSKKSHTDLGVPTGQGVGTGFVQGLKESTIGIVQAIGVTLDAAKIKAITDVADMMSKVNAALTGGISAGSAVGSFVTPDAAKTRGVGAWLSGIEAMFTGMAKGADPKVLAAIGVYADTLGKIVAPITSAVAAIDAVAGSKGVSENQLAAVFNPILLMTQKARDIAGIVGDLTNVGTFGDNLGKILAPLKDAAAILATFPTFKGVTEQQLAAVLNPLILVAEKERDSASIVGAAGAVAGAAYGENLGKMVAPLKDAITVLTGIGDVPMVSEQQIANVTNPMILLAEKERDAAKIVGDITQAGAYGETMGKVLAGLMAWPDFILKLKNAGDLTISQSVIDTLSAGVKSFISGMSQIATEIGTDGVKAAGDVGDAAGKVVSAMSAALSLFLTLGNEQGTPGTPSSSVRRYTKKGKAVIVTTPGTPGTSFEGILAQAQARIPVLMSAVKALITGFASAAQGLVSDMGGGDSKAGDKILAAAASTAGDINTIAGGLGSTVKSITDMGAPDTLKNLNAGIANTTVIISTIIRAEQGWAVQLAGAGKAFPNAAHAFLADLNDGLATVAQAAHSTSTLLPIPQTNPLNLPAYHMNGGQMTGAGKAGNTYNIANTFHNSRQPVADMNRDLELFKFLREGGD